MAGGIPGQSPDDSLLYDPVLRTWTSLPGNSPEGNRAVRLLDGRVLVAGGVWSGTETAAEAFLFTGGIVPVQPVVTLDVTAPTALSVVDGTYAPNPFTVTATVGNSGTSTAQGVNLTLFLPDGLTLSEGSTTQFIVALPAGQQRQVVWSVRAAGQKQDVTPTYFVTATPSNAAGKSVTKQIMLPGGALTVASITSNVGGDTGSVTIHVNGGGFLNGATVKLVRAGQPDIVGTAVNVSDDGFGLVVTFDLTGQTRGAWDVVVTNPDGATVTLDGTFTIEQGRAAEVWVDVIGLPAIRAGRPSTFYVMYGNHGNVDHSGSGGLWIAFPDYFVWSLPGGQEIIQASSTTGSSFVALPLPAIPAGQSVMLPLTLTAPNNPPEQFSIDVWTNVP